MITSRGTRGTGNTRDSSGSLLLALAGACLIPALASAAQVCLERTDPLSAAQAEARAAAEVGAQAVAQAQAKTGAEVRASVSILTDRNLILLPISVAGSAPFNVVLDTGMPTRGVILYRSARVDALPLEFADSHALTGAGGTGEAIPTRIAMGAKVEVGGLVLSDVPIISLVAPAAFPPSHEGIIGSELFEKFAVRVDVDEQRLTLLESATFVPGEGSSVVPLHFRGGGPFLEARVAVGAGDPIPAELAVDLGASHGLWLNSGKQSRFVAPKAGIETRLGRGLSGILEGRVGRVRRFEIGDFAFENVVALFPNKNHQDPGGVHFQDGLVGGETLRRFRVTFDYAGKRMVLERGARFGDPSEFDMTGLVLEPSGPDRRVVRAVIPDSPAAQAGVQIGDVIVAIDGKPVREMGGDGIMRGFRVNDAEVRLSIERGTATLEKKFRLRRLV